MKGPVAIACTLIMLAVAPAARADVTIGSSLATPPSPPGLECTPTRCSYSPTAIPGRQVTAPASGVITRWRIRTGATVTPVTLQVVRRPSGTGAQPGTEVGRSAQEAPPVNATTVYPTRIPIALGDFLAIECCATGQGQFFELGASPSTMDQWSPALDGTAQPPAVPGAPAEVLVNADIEPDVDTDGWGDETQDNCPSNANPGQEDLDHDGVGDACDTDDDGDGHANNADNCPDTANADQANADGDALGDACDDDRDGDGDANAADNCPDAANAGQTDADGDTLGDACDPDRDGDGVLNSADTCPDLAGPTGSSCPAPPPGSPAPKPPVARFRTPLAGTGIGASQRIELDVADDGGDPVVSVFDEDGTVCVLRAAPYACTWNPTGADVGRATLLASAVDADGLSTLAIVRVRVNRFTAPLTRRVRRQGRRTRVSGRLRLPAAVEPRLGCRGNVTVQIRRVRRTVALTRGCTYAAQLRVRTGRPRVSFAGNSVIAPT